MPAQTSAFPLAVLTAIAGLACTLPPVTVALDESAPPPVVAEFEPDASTEVYPVQGECPAEVSEYPAPYFSDRVLIRLPKGVTEDNFVEFTPTFARLAGPVESTNCHEGMPGAMINFMALSMFADDPTRPLETVRDELLEALGYPSSIQLVEANRGEDGRRGIWTYDVPPSHDSPEPAKFLLQMFEAHGDMIVVIYEVHPNAWPVIVNTLMESASRMAALPP